MRPVIGLIPTLAICWFNEASCERSSGCGVTPPVSPGYVELLDFPSIDPIFGDIARTYRLMLPFDYDNNTEHKILFDFHGYTMDSKEEMHQSKMVDLTEKGVILVWPDGSNDTNTSLRAWNAVGTSNNIGPLGYTCNRNRTKWGEYECYDSCLQIHSDCNELNECYCYSCWDDIAFIEQLIGYLESVLCIDLLHIHSTGISSGGMISYQIGQSLSYIFASIIPVEGAPLLGFNNAPENVISLLDFRGTGDTMIPGNVSNSYDGLVGPYNTTWSSDGYYYANLDDIMAVFNDTNECNGTWAHWATEYDGIRDFYCVMPYGSCPNGIDIIRCSGDWGHAWPLHTQKTAYPNIVWKFISTHPKPQLLWNPKKDVY